jgi:hypothetical protein
MEKWKGDCDCQCSWNFSQDYIQSHSTQQLKSVATYEIARHDHPCLPALLVVVSMWRINNLKKTQLSREYVGLSTFLYPHQSFIAPRQHTLSFY